MTGPVVIVTPTARGARLAIRVIPRASRAEVAGVRDGRLLVRVTAPPVDSAANDAVVQILATVLQLPKRALSIESGHASKNKAIAVTGLDTEQIRRRLRI